MSYSHSISREDQWILTKPVQIYNWEMKKNWIDFGDLVSIFKVTEGQRLLKNALSALYLLKE